MQHPAGLLIIANEMRQCQPDNPVSVYLYRHISGTEPIYTHTAALKTLIAKTVYSLYNKKRYIHFYNEGSRIMPQVPESRKTLASVIGCGTEKLYYADAYMREFDAVVQTCRRIRNPGTDEVSDRYAVTLDRTAFFPEEGGQSPDRGILTAGSASDISEAGIIENDGSGKSIRTISAQVLDVQICGGIITHVTDIPFEPGTRVHGSLDFHHRFSNMQQHSAEHLFSGLVWSLFGLTNVGFHLSDTEVTMDYSGRITANDAADLELKVNRLIWKNIESRQEFPSREELKSYEYRSKTAIEGQVRLVIFPGCDICACCAPHVARTGEIGIFRILSVQSHRGGVRIHMLAGERAFRYLARENALLTGAARSLSTSTDQVPVRIENLRTELSETKHLLSEARLSLLMKEADDIPASQQNVCLFTEGLEEMVLRETVNHLMKKHAGSCGIFNGNDTGGYRYVIGSLTDISDIQKRLRDVLHARGGGRPPMIQGQVHASADEIRALFECGDQSNVSIRN